MVLRMVLRKAVNTGVNRLAGGKSGPQGVKAAKRARQAMRVTRRLNKF
jgi:hypothetical protein